MDDRRATSRSGHGLGTCRRALKSPRETAISLPPRLQPLRSRAWGGSSLSRQCRVHGSRQDDVDQPMDRVHRLLDPFQGIAEDRDPFAYVSKPPFARPEGIAEVALAIRCRGF